MLSNDAKASRGGTQWGRHTLGPHTHTTRNSAKAASRASLQSASNGLRLIVAALPQRTDFQQ